MRVLSYDEAAARSGIVRRTLERAIANGEGPSVIHISTRRRGILESDLEKWLLSRRRPAPGDAVIEADRPIPISQASSSAGKTSARLPESVKARIGGAR
jgi:predicted DNA-binding transcriptional regulator AlpA